ncbi:MAG: hypothetical protein ACYSU0_04210 [Planctomycetota bacterium]|jgi:hypothetical protein
MNGRVCFVACLAVVIGCGSDDPSAPPEAPPVTSKITIDGVNDFAAADEAFTTTSAGLYTAYVTWDETYLYVGMDGTDVGTSGGTRYLLVYVGGASGTTTGVSLGVISPQEPVLPFAAEYLVRWVADGAADGMIDLVVWGGSTWDASAFNGEVARSGNYVEIGVPLAHVGSPATVRLHISMVNAAVGSEWTYAGVPSSSFTDGDDPDYTKYYEFDLAGAQAPNAYSPLP